MKPLKLIILTIFLITSLTACSVYKMEVQQGNALSNETVSQLRPGMSKTEVATLLGTPLLNDGFHKNRWDYVYFSNKKGNRSAQKSLTLFFRNGQLTQVKN